MKQVCIVAAKRTPHGKFLGALRNVSAVDLACAAGAAALSGIDPAAVDQVIVGHVLGAGQGMNLARQVGVRLGLPQHVPAYAVNMMCASGMQAVRLAAQAIRAGEAAAVLCGGTESMSNAPYLLPRARQGYRIGDGKLVDSLLNDGLIDPFDGRHMGLTAEALAARYGISREEQDRFALLSRQRCAAACERGALAAELAPLAGLTVDEGPRAGVTLSDLASLKPAFVDEGTVTAGNASTLNDGAAMLVVAERAAAESRGWPVLAVLEASAVRGCDPAWMGLGPVHAIRQLCGQTGSRCDDFDAIEINEAFAAQTLACLRELELDPSRINACGGAISLGHPLGASGARLLVHLAHRIAAGECRRGLAALCAGGGMGIAAAIGKLV